METFLFVTFTSLAIISAISVIQVINPIHSVIALILCFVNVSALLILLDLDFFAMIFLVVYIGAIAVLFLFVVMMINIKMEEIYENMYRYLPIYLPLGTFIGIIFLFEITVVINNHLIPLDFSNWELFSKTLAYAHLSGGLSGSLSGSVESIQNYLHKDNFVSYAQWADLMENATTIEVLAKPLYVYYFDYYLLASIILLVAMISAIVLTLSQTISVHRQEAFIQNLRESHLKKKEK